MLQSAYLRLHGARLVPLPGEERWFECDLHRMVMGVAVRAYSEADVAGQIAKFRAPYSGTELFGFAKEYPGLIERLSKT